MNNKVSGLLRRYLAEQIGLEEDLARIIKQQTQDINEAEYPDAKKLLEETQSALEDHFVPLNEALDRIELEVIKEQKESSKSNGKPGGFSNTLPSYELEHGFVSRLLRDDYSALNLITMGNSLLHTTALALDRQDVASVSLRHLENLAPLVVKIGRLLPEVAARELRSEAPDIDLSIAQVAWQNIVAAWQKTSEL